MSLRLMYITNNPKIALIAEQNGVDRIWIDLETLGKEERQKGINSVKSNHSISDISSISKILTSSELLVRVNPWNEDSVLQINQVIDAGAELIMLPMWRSPEEVKSFIEVVSNRTKTILLLETKEAIDCLDEVLNLSGIDEIHIGLNDLHIALGKTFMFELLADGTVESLCRKIRKARIPYGFGGIAKIGDGLLPAEKIILEHYRLGSTRAILSRTFCDNAHIQDIEEIRKVFELNMKKLRTFEEYAAIQNEEALLKNKEEVLIGVKAVVEMMRKVCIHE
ncbi:aldolase/citrate lyase family protein [Sphaerochaeta globosa]|uniref:HpcH/HpaI aldolase n=1 Tax=Sphaerochaeta globosa (strain ATCC BAA-1886 / DSM 22777 / Buddy) TaxID=158189 RepID=F0RXS4_SPHGB|nr:aldolase/citrate lyase family protein [Sphaerochaeta globosa]ADY12201.1 HpcH/HpaI aldolase [Sphaerochaeta globosa str. Buddy]